MTPDKFTIEECMVDAGHGHSLYVQLWGAKDAARKIIYLHGGPGSGCSDKAKTMFDSGRQQVLFFDQRGSGRSTPYGLLENNDTDKLIGDINLLADSFEFDTFTIVGGSWGSLLGLAYAIRNPKRVERLVLRGIFTGRQSEIDFVDQGGFRSFFPDIWEQFVDSVPAKYRQNPRKYHLPRVLGKDPAAAKKSAYAYALLEGSVVRLDDRVSSDTFEDFDPVPTIIECHYLANQCFLPEGYILDSAAKLTMPVFLVQGRYDAVCAPVTAYELYRKLPNAQLQWTVAGHSGQDRANWEVTRALLLA